MIDGIILPTDSTASESEFEMVASLTSKDSDRDSPASSTQVPILGSDVTIENRLLKNELASLHQELTHTAERNQKYKEGKLSFHFHNFTGL